MASNRTLQSNRPDQNRTEAFECAAIQCGVCRRALANGVPLQA